MDNRISGLDWEVVQRVVLETLRDYFAGGLAAQDTPVRAEPPDLMDAAVRAQSLVERPADTQALQNMQRQTPARIAVGHSGPRLRTRTLLTLRADHAAARDAVFTDVPDALLEQLGLFCVQTRCTDKNTFLTRPDLGQQFGGAAQALIRERCAPNPQVQVYVSDGLSSKAIEANVPDTLPALLDGLRDQNLAVGTPFFVRYGRVPAMDRVTELTGAEVTCVLIGERPGLATPESMSAYLTYRGTVGMPEARRTVVSNIHRAGIPAVEAGAYIAELVGKLLQRRASGVELRL